ncbi:hypothetical protein Tco_1134429 [Tanacetum coccineum]
MLWFFIQLRKGTTSSIFSPTPPREPTLPRDESKGKGIATEEPLKDTMPFMEEGGSVPKISSLKSFVIPEGPLSQEDVMDQLKEMKKLADLKTKKEKYEESLKKLLKKSATIKAQKQKMAEHEAKRKNIYRVNSSKEATMRITRANDPPNVTVHDKFRLKTLGFSEWLKVHSLASKSKVKSNDLLLQSLKAKFEWVLTQAKALGIPPPPELSTFGLSVLAVDKKRKKSSEILEEVFMKENVVVDGMHRILVPPPGIKGRQGLVIREPESGIFFYNRNWDLRGTPEANEMFRKLELTIEARDDAAQARDIVKDNLDGLGQHIKQHQTYSSQRHRQGSRRLLEDILISWDGYQLAGNSISPRGATKGDLSCLYQVRVGKSNEQLSELFTKVWVGSFHEGRCIKYLVCPPLVY